MTERSFFSFECGFGLTFSKQPYLYALFLSHVLLPHISCLWFVFCIGTLLHKIPCTL